MQKSSIMLGRRTLMFLLIISMIWGAAAHASDETGVDAARDAIAAAGGDVDSCRQWYISRDPQEGLWVFAATARDADTALFSGQFWYVNGDTATFLSEESRVTDWDACMIESGSGVYCYSTQGENDRAFSQLDGVPEALTYPDEIVGLSYLGNSILGALDGQNEGFCVLRREGSRLTEAVPEETDAETLAKKHDGFRELMQSIESFVNRYYGGFALHSYLYYDTDLAIVNFSYDNDGEAKPCHTYLYTEDGCWTAEVDSAAFDDDDGVTYFIEDGYYDTEPKLGKN